MVSIDGWQIPATEAEAYRAARERTARRALEVLQAICARTDRRWAGSEDGEAVVGLDADDELVAVIHLDPSTVERAESMDDGALEDWIRRLAADPTRE